MDRYPSENIDMALENAAQFLPEGFQVEVTIERHGYGVNLLVDGTYHHADGNDLADCVDEAVDMAIVLSTTP